jgi:DNA topoisomerase-1
MDNYIIRKIDPKDSKKYNFYTFDNKKIENKLKLEKLKSIYIAPAYKNVKIYLDQDILATGIDSAGRKQYIYSNESKDKRESKKYCQLVKLGDSIVKLKKKINNDLLCKSMTKDKMVALILKIMDLCNFRGGNKKYEEKYGSYGLTTLHKDHVKIKNDSVEIEFIGKKGVNNHCIIQNEKIQDIIKIVYNNVKKNDYIFSVTNNGSIVDININDLNKYLESFNITSKDLRTWNANIIFLKSFKSVVEDAGINVLTDMESEKKIKFKKKLINEALKKTAVLLHHTAYICKNSYIYKNILEQILDNDYIVKKLGERGINFEDLLKKILVKDKNYENC